MTHKFITICGTPICKHCGISAKADTVVDEFNCSQIKAMSLTHKWKEDPGGSEQIPLFRCVCCGTSQYIVYGSLIPAVKTCKAEIMEWALS